MQHVVACCCVLEFSGCLLGSGPAGSSVGRRNEKSICVTSSRIANACELHRCKMVAGRRCRLGHPENSQHKKINKTLTSSRRFNHLPQGLSSNISLSSSESSPLSLGDLCSVSLFIWLPDITNVTISTVRWNPRTARPVRVKTGYLLHSTWIPSAFNSWRPVLLEILLW